MPVKSVSTNVNERIRRSGVGWIRMGEPPAGISASRPRVSATASAIPTAPPTSERSTLSVSSWRTSCHRVAPIDSRTAISRCRMKPRAISRLATFAHAISSTRPTMHINTMSAVEKSFLSGE